MMKKMSSKLVAVVAVIAMMCMMLTGCGEKLAPADQSMNALFELYAKNNAAPMKDLLGFASEEDVAGAFFEEDVNVDMAEMIQSELESGGITMTEEEVKELTDAMNTMIGKVACTVEITSEEKDAVEVTMMVTGFSNDDMTNVIMDAANAMVESITEEDQMAIASGDEEVLNAYMQQYMKDFMSGLAALDTDGEAIKVVVPCEKLLVDVNGKEKAAWLPSNMNAFSDDIDAAMFH